MIDASYELHFMVKSIVLLLNNACIFHYAQNEVTTLKQGKHVFRTSKSFPYFHFATMFESFRKCENFNRFNCKNDIFKATE